MIINLDHIAILTTSLERSVAQLPSWFVPQEIEEQPTEGTREQYITSSNEAKTALLFLEAVQQGPYQSALERRGPGLHHLGCSTDALDEAIDHFAGNGLLLHPISLKTHSRNAVWMCRPGVPFLLELYQSPEVRDHLREEVLIELPQASAQLPSSIAYVPKTLILSTSAKKIRISIGDHSLSINP